MSAAATPAPHSPITRQLSTSSEGSAPASTSSQGTSNAAVSICCPAGGASELLSTTAWLSLRAVPPRLEGSVFSYLAGPAASADGGVAGPFSALALGLLRFWIDFGCAESQSAAIRGSLLVQELLVNVPVPSSPLALLHIRILLSEVVCGCQEKKSRRAEHQQRVAAAPAVLPLRCLPRHSLFGVCWVGNGAGAEQCWLGPQLALGHGFQQLLNSYCPPRSAQPPRRMTGFGTFMERCLKGSSEQDPSSLLL